MSRRRPPGPSGMPLVGNMFDWIRAPFDFKKRCKEEYGDVVMMNVGQVEVCMLSHPEDVNRVLRETDTFVKPDIVRNRFERIMGNALLVSEGEFWQRQRALIQPAFYRKRLERYSEEMVSSTENLVGRWVAGNRYDVRHEMATLTLDILTSTMFDSDLDYDLVNMEEALEGIYTKFQPKEDSLYVPDFIPTPSNIKYKRSADRLDDIVQKLVEDGRSRDEGGEDLLSMLLGATTEDGVQMEDKQLRDELVNMILAGHETTALALTYTWYLLCKNPRAKEKLHAEIDNVLGETSPTFEDLDELEYAEKVLKEAMRIYTPLHALPREATEDVELGGYDVSSGTILSCNLSGVHHDDRWYDEPESFRPERWSADFEAELPDGAYVPFGGGPRRCIGYEFAMIESKIILAIISQHFDMELVTEDPLELRYAGLSVQPENSIDVRLRRREP